MENPIITTKKTSILYLANQIPKDIAFVIIGIFCQSMVERLRYNWEFSAANNMGTAAELCFIVACLSFTYHVMVSQTVAEVYSDKIVGKGMQKLSVKSFDLRYDQITEISTSKGLLNVETGSCVFLVINTSGNEYKIITTPDRAKEIMEHYNDMHN
ncbi:MAG: hypothetical protein IJE29_03365 [Firmicutes bacterium]|nr:hypothetical protein [Bacillota bacterium]